MNKFQSYDESKSTKKNNKGGQDTETASVDRTRPNGPQNTQRARPKTKRGSSTKPQSW